MFFNTLISGIWRPRPVSAQAPLPVSFGAFDSSALTRSTVTMSGASAVLLAASPTRTVVIVSSSKANADAAIDISGGTCALDVGIPLAAGDTMMISGKAAQSAMTQFGTSTNKLTVYVG